MSATCRVCGLVHVADGSTCAACERREAAHIAWCIAVAAPKCPCSKPMKRCDDCAALYCDAPGHLVHVCGGDA